MKKFLILALALFTIVGTADAQRKKGSKKNKGAQTTAQAPQGPKKESFTKPSDGLFGVSRKGKDWYFIVPDSVLNQPILAVTRYIATPVGAGVYGGEEVNEQTVYWEQGVDSTLILRSWVIGAMSKEGDRISQAVQNAHENPVIASCKIEGRVGQGSRVKVTRSSRMRLLHSACHSVPRGSTTWVILPVVPASLRTSRLSLSIPR